MNKRLEEFFERNVRVVGKSPRLRDPKKADVTIIPHDHLHKMRAGMFYHCVSEGAIPLIEGVERDTPAVDVAARFGVISSEALGWDSLQPQFPLAEIPDTDPQALLDAFWRIEPERIGSLTTEIETVRKRFPERRIAVFIGQAHVTRRTAFYKRLMQEKSYTVAVLAFGK